MKLFKPGDLIAVQYAFPEGYGYGDVTMDVVKVIDSNEIALCVAHTSADLKEWINMQASVVVSARTLTAQELKIHQRRMQELKLVEKES